MLVWEEHHVHSNSPQRSVAKPLTTTMYGKANATISPSIVATVWSREPSRGYTGTTMARARTWEGGQGWGMGYQG